MKRVSLILTVFLLGVGLVSCGTTLKKTSDKGSVAETVVQLEKTAKPILGTEENKNIKIFIEDEVNSYQAKFKIKGKAGTVEPYATVLVKVLYWYKYSYVDVGVKEEAVTADQNGSFEIKLDHIFDYGKYQFTITAQAPGKEKSEPLEFSENIYK